MAGGITFAKAKLALVTRRDDLAALATILSAIVAIGSLAIARASLRLQQSVAAAQTPPHKQ
jgi:hypothetical protein